MSRQPPARLGRDGGPRASPARFRRTVQGDQDVNSAFGELRTRGVLAVKTAGRVLATLLRGFASPASLVALGGLIAAWPACFAVRAGEEPPALNPFARVREDRDDMIPGYVEMSDGRIFVGTIYMTRDKRLKIEDDAVGTGSESAGGATSEKRQREIPLRAIRQIEAKVEKEWMEKEWRFKESALDEKVYTGRAYPARKYLHTVTLIDGRAITGPVAEIFYVRPIRESATDPPAEDDVEPIRLMIHKRDKGEPGTTLEQLAYVRLIKLGADAVEEGKKKAAGMGSASPRRAKKTLAPGKRRPPAEPEPTEDGAGSPPSTKKSGPPSTKKTRRAAEGPPLAPPKARTPLRKDEEG